MTLSTINVGSTANDGTGDPLRTAFQKVNANFVLLAGEIYDVVRDGGADPLGVIDSTANFTAAVAANLDVFVPPGTYKISSTITLPGGCCLRGIQHVSILKPTAALAGALIQMGSQSRVEGLYLDGINTTNCMGIQAGDGSTLINLVYVRGCEVWRFAGATGYGIKLNAQLVTGSFSDTYVDACGICLYTTGSNTPVDCVFFNCQFRGATTKGVSVNSGYSLNFIKCLFEANGEEGFYIQSVGLNATDIRISQSWFEGNWVSVASGALRHAKYDMFVDGANGPAGTIRTVVRDCYFNADANSAKSMHLTNDIDFLVDQVKVFSEAANILVDGNSYGQFPNWLGANGAIASTVSNTSSVTNAVFNCQTHILDTIEPAWVDYTPTVTGNGGMTISGLAVTMARYKVFGKNLFVQFLLTFTTATAGGPLVKITLPTNVRTLNASLFNLALIDDGTTHTAYLQSDGANPTSTLQVGHVDGTNWGLGASRAVYGSYVLELF